MKRKRSKDEIKITVDNQNKFIKFRHESMKILDLIPKIFLRYEKKISKKKMKRN